MEINNSATDTPAQEINDRIEQALYGSDNEEPEAVEGEVVAEDTEELPEVDDTDSEDEEGSSGLDDIAEAEDQTLAAYLGLDEDKLEYDEDGQVVFNAIIDGEKKAVPLKDVVASYQLQGHVNNKSMALETERKEFETQRTEITNGMAEKVQQLDALGQALESQLVEEFNSIDWDKLRVQDSAEWTALRQEYAEKAQKLQQVQAKIAQEGKQLYEQRQQEMEQQRQQYLQSEMSMMLEKNPDWIDQSRLQSDMSDLRDFASNQYGFSDDDLAQVYDHRLISVLQDAQAYRNGAKAAETKKVKNVPRFQKPGAAKANSAQLAKAREAKARKAAVKKTGHVNDVAKLLIDRM